MKKNTARYFVENDSLFSYGAVIFFLLSFVFCILGSLGRWDDRFFIISQVILPAACTLVFVVFMKLFGQRLFFMTCLPAVLGLAFFVIRAFTYENIAYLIISVVLSLSSVFLYTAVVVGWIKRKWPLIPIFLVDFFFDAYVKGYHTLRNPEIAVSFSAVMQEISVLFIILAMLFVSLAMKNKRGIESMGLPKIRSPKVIVKKEQEKEAAAVPALKPEENEEKPLPAAPEAAELESAQPKEIPEAAAAPAEEKESAVSEEAEKENAEMEPDSGTEL